MIPVFLFLAIAYMRGWLRLRARSAQAVGPWRATGFLLGLVLIWMARASPMASGQAHSLTVHMAQHLVLMSLAPPLIWLAEPVRLVSFGLPSRLMELVVLAVARWRPIQRLGQLLGHPLVCWLAATTALIAWHVPALLMLSVHSAGWRAIAQASFLAGGLLFWWPVVRPWPSSSTEPSWSIVLYLFLATLPCDVLSGFLVFSERIAYPHLSATGPLSVSVLDDQQRAGALMWTAITIIYAVAGVIVATRSLSRPSPHGKDPSALQVACDLRTGVVP
jgi:cytochrome c oxidase assembly factor CtaG